MKISAEENSKSIKPDEKVLKDKNYLKRVWSSYEHSFVLNLALLYVNGGFKVLYDVALKEMFRTFYKMSPNELQVAEAFIIMPWDFKIFYGIICDTIKIPFYNAGPKRGYLIIFSTLQCILLLMVGLFQFENPSAVINLVFMCSFCGAFMDVVIDGITCI
jgi:hypothetical protein